MEVLTASSDDRDNRGDVREEGQRGRLEEREEEQKWQRLKEQTWQHARRETSSHVVVTMRTTIAGCTHTFRSSDVHGAGDVREALVHAHLQVNHPVKTAAQSKLIWYIHTYTHKHIGEDTCFRGADRWSCYCRLARGLKHSWIVSVCTCWLLKCRKLKKKKSEVFPEFKELSTHRRNLSCLDPTQTSNVETTDCSSTFSSFRFWCWYHRHGEKTVRFVFLIFREWNSNMSASVWKTQRAPLLIH